MAAAPRPRPLRTAIAQLERSFETFYVGGDAADVATSARGWIRELAQLLSANSEIKAALREITDFAGLESFTDIAAADLELRGGRGPQGASSTSPGARRPACSRRRTTRSPTSPRSRPQEDVIVGVEEAAASSAPRGPLARRSPARDRPLQPQRPFGLRDPLQRPAHQAPHAPARPTVTRQPAPARSTAPGSPTSPAAPRTRSPASGSPAACRAAAAPPWTSSTRKIRLLREANTKDQGEVKALQLLHHRCRRLLNEFQREQRREAYEGALSAPAAKRRATSVRCAWTQASRGCWRSTPTAGVDLRAAMRVYGRGSAEAMDAAAAEIEAANDLVAYREREIVQGAINSSRALRGRAYAPPRWTRCASGSRRAAPTPKSSTSTTSASSRSSSASSC